jgi:hypothetical protein
MNATDWIPIVIAVVGAAGGIGAFINGRRSTLSGEATTMIADAIKLKNEYKLELDCMKLKVAELIARVETLEAEIEKVTLCSKEIGGDNIDLKDWADRLVHQVQSFGGTPVKLRQKKASAAK